MATRVFEGIKLFQDRLKRTMAGTFLWNFIKIRKVVLEKMFKEQVNARTTDNGPWHKLAGLWPVELKNKSNYSTPNTLVLMTLEKKPFERIFENLKGCPGTCRAKMTLAWPWPLTYLNLTYKWHFYLSTLYHTNATSNDLNKEGFWKHCGKRR